MAKRSSFKMFAIVSNVEENNNILKELLIKTVSTIIIFKMEEKKRKISKEIDKVKLNETIKDTEQQ